MEYFTNPKIDFISKRTLFFFVSISVTIIGIIFVLFLGVEYGIDFEGGTEIAVKFSKTVDTEHIRKAIDGTGLTGSEIKSYGKENQYLIRIKESERASELVQEALRKTFSDMDLTILKVDKIGPKIGSELRGQAYLAVLLSVVAILIYIAFRFDFVFGLGAIVAMAHDLLVTFAIVIVAHHAGLMNLEINQSILAAFLTVVGYSINDTVIIFDRIRENKDRYKGKNFINMVNTSINETLSRTVNTVGTVLIVLIIMIFFGGPVLEGFAFTMTIGVITGTYSSIYIASSFVIWYLEKVKKIDLSTGIEKKGVFSSAKA